jgi:hypothetical protein
MAGEIFIPICCERLTEPDEGRVFAELLATLLVRAFPLKKSGEMSRECRFAFD